MRRHPIVTISGHWNVQGSIATGKTGYRVAVLGDRVEKHHDELLDGIAPIAARTTIDRVRCPASE
ncbi:hypothetical protein GCM10009799_19220 [Nocardiopsis rhodophaea]|uniref:Uncharacterized protein n=1 Tax=Nocardiopsis rhodophaea TaxID=280238 RepID=A0ABN2SVV1_9ACTN